MPPSGLNINPAIVCFISPKNVNNTCENYCLWSTVNKGNRMTAVEKWQNYYSLQWHDVNELAL